VSIDVINDDDSVTTNTFMNIKKFQDSVNMIEHTLIQNTSYTSISDFSAYVNVWSQSYTPKYTNSKILLTYALQIQSDRNDGADGRFALKLEVDGSNYYETSELGGYDRGASGIWLKQLYSVMAEVTNTDGTGKTFNISLSNNSDGKYVSLNADGGLGQGNSYLHIIEIKQ
jgi:hypothetical protein